MKTILVDDELWTMEQFEEDSKDISEIEIVGKFSRSVEAYEFAKANQVDFALLDIEMPEMNGIELGKKLRELYPDIIIVFVTGYDKYLPQAILEMKADYYVMKPYSQKDVEDVLNRAALLAGRQKKRVRIHTFGRFDVFVDDKLMHFTNAKAKELLAVCVDRLGGSVSMEEIIDKLWEEREYDRNVKSLYRKAVIYLNSIFKEYDVHDVFVSERASCHINKDEVICDYYDYLKGDGKQEFCGEYMFDYSWAEETVAKLYGE